jgi:chaperone BCS1
MFEELVKFVREQVEQNELFKGGLLLMVGGAILALVRGWPSRILAFIKRQSMVVIDVPDRDKAFQWVNHWLAEQTYSKRWARLLTVRTEPYGKEFDKPRIIFSPAPGTHWLWYKKRLVILSRERQQMGQGGEGNNRDPFREYFTIRIFGRKREYARELINEAYELTHPQTVNKVTIHRTKNYGDWLISKWVPDRPLESVILDAGVSDRLVNDIQTFLDSEQWYVQRGLPYRRGYLFYGPPGNGKTSVVMAMATHFNLDIAILNIKSSEMSDDDLTEAIANVPRNTIILIEDIDCIATGRESEVTVTFSGLLNALDGLAAGHGQLVFMTTNFRNRLDSALIRPGRCDVQIEFPNATPEQKTRLFNRFFPDSDLGQSFSNHSPDNVSMAELQKHMMVYRNDPQQAFKHTINIKAADEQETN